MHPISCIAKCEGIVGRAPLWAAAGVVAFIGGIAVAVVSMRLGGWRRGVKGARQRGHLLQRSHRRCGCRRGGSGDGGQDRISEGDVADRRVLL
jgi:hypothetical protein